MYKLLFSLLLGFSIQAHAQPYLFEGYWCNENFEREYSTDYVRFYGHGCDYSGIYGKVEQVNPDHWKINATCLVSFTDEDENGETFRGNRDAETYIELTLNNNKLIESWIYDFDQPNAVPEVSEYQRCER